MRDYMKPYRGERYFQYENIKNQESIELICGYCGQTVAPNQGYSITCFPLGATTCSTAAYIYECPHCKNPIFYFCRTGETIPGAMYGREVKNLPENIQKLYNECRTCYSNQCYTASQMIARTILMHIAVEQGAETNKTFAYYVNYLDNQGYIPPNGKKWVDFIRTSGNVANHEIIIKEKDETEKVILFLSTLLMFIYELPSALPE